MSRIGSTGTPTGGDEDWKGLEELPEAFFQHGRVRKGGKVVREATASLSEVLGGKPATARKRPISIRLSPEVLDYFRGTGEGWQTRLDELLLAHVRTQQEKSGKRSAA